MQEMSLQTGIGVVAFMSSVTWGLAAPGDPVDHAMNWGVLFLMAMPYVVLGSVTLWLFFYRWRAAKKGDGLEVGDPLAHPDQTTKEGKR